ncbi:kelch-like protein 28 [Adelges cooleyi]|uniref:kelch-like protein 28 n=1 Tax=Adelges cooleyi TaxID=133065 RepID=UPI00217F5BF9|nr:kelch-like protein 28 [Adelges cooleyi]XP_050420994.1 kelch-like protein 28 [Adelges cooleyi]
MDIRYKDHLKWQSSDNLLFCPPRAYSRMVASENGIILAIGGKKESGHWVNLIDELDLKSTSKKQWVPTKPLNRPQFDFAVCTRKQYIYVVGGCDFSYGNCFNSVEYYDTNSKVWTEIIKTMPTARRWCSAITNNDDLYVFGGKNGADLSTVECYDFAKKNWKQFDPMPICNSTMGVTIIENYIYIIGGVCESQRVFKFDLRHSKWSEMPKTHLKTSYATSSFVNKGNDIFLFVNEGGRIYCEIYDAEKKQWQWAAKAGVCIGTNIVSFNEGTLKSYGIHFK